MARARRLETPYSSLNNRQKKFVDAVVLRGMTYAKAAEYAEYSGDLYGVGAEMAKRENIRAAMDERLKSLHDKVEMDPTEVLQRLTNVGRDPHHKDHVKALETLAKIHGLTQDTLNVKLDKNSLLQAVDAEIERVKGLGPVVDVEARLLAAPASAPVLKPLHEMTRREFRKKQLFAALLIKQGKPIPPSMQPYAPGGERGPGTPLPPMRISLGRGKSAVVQDYAQPDEVQESGLRAGIEGQLS